MQNKETAVAAAAFLLLAVDAKLKGPVSTRLDPYLHSKIPQNQKLGELLSVMGDPKVQALMTALDSWRLKNNKQAIRDLLMSSGGGWLSWMLAKSAVNTHRPGEYSNLSQPGGQAFPSGHTTTGYGYYASALHILSNNGYDIGITPRQLGLTTGLLVGLGRLFLGVHWTSDVLGGLALGELWYQTTAHFSK